jgi:hypothetical protein
MRSLGLCSLMLHVIVVCSTELTFELPDNDKQCFYEELQNGVKFDLDFQVSDSIRGVLMPFPHMVELVSALDCFI